MKERAFYDTSMFLEPFDKRSDRKRTNDILAVLKGLVRSIEEHSSPITSSGVLGEIELILRDSEKIKRFKEDITVIKSIIDGILKRFEIIGIDENAIKKCYDLIQKEDREIECMDALHLSSAISSNCNSFCFIDNKLRDNKIVKEYAKENVITLTSF
ncbi:PIN domain-containing protein [Candidatus Woesearchaeota archaeon]|nr:PIN domain-containing protein [Candidatus Woesearchaeota archaeon]